jgi:hypothetical protein
MDKEKKVLLLAGKLAIAARLVINSNVYNLSKRIEELGIEEVEIRSVLTCELKRGVCSKCYGRNLATNKMAQIGDAVGVVAAGVFGEKEVASYIDTTNNAENPLGELLWNGGSSGLPSPFGETSGIGDRDWELFAFAPYGVCLTGEREVGLTPAVMASAVHCSLVGDGQPDDMQRITNDGFSDGDMFVGFA